jgi:hypothetical protein
MRRDGRAALGAIRAGWSPSGAVSRFDGWAAGVMVGSRSGPRTSAQSRRTSRELREAIEEWLLAHPEEWQTEPRAMG